jgi:hypothetical protein
LFFAAVWRELLAIDPLDFGGESNDQPQVLRADVEYPQYSFENTSGRDRLASGTSIGDVLFRKMIPDALSRLVCQPNHPTFIADRLRG